MQHSSYIRLHDIRVHWKGIGPVGAAMLGGGGGGWWLKGCSNLRPNREYRNEKMRAFGKLVAKSGLLVTGLSIVALLGAHVLTYYSLTMDYEITPLTDGVRITVPVKSLNFSELPVEASPKVDATITTFKPNTMVHFKVNEIPYAVTLGRVFYSVEILIRVGGRYAMLTLVNNNRWWGNGDIEAYLVLTSPVTRAPVEITVLATAARHGPVSESVEIVVSLVEIS